MFLPLSDDVCTLEPAQQWRVEATKNTYNASFIFGWKWIMLLSVYIWKDTISVSFFGPVVHVDIHVSE